MVKKKINETISRIVGGEKKWLFVGQIFQAATSILVTKFITIFISPSDYGAFISLFLIAAFFETAIFVPLNRSFMSFFYIEQEKEISVFYYQVFILVTLAISFFLFLYPFFFQEEANMLGVGFLVVYLFFRNGLFFFNNIFLTKKEYKKFAYNLVGSSLLYLIILYSLLRIGFTSGYVSLWLSNIIANGVMFIYLIFLLKENIVFFLFRSKEIFHNSYFQGFVKFVKPLIFFSFFSFLLNQSDRYIIQYLSGSKEVGLYNAAYGLASKPYSLMILPFFQIILAELSKLSYSSDSKKIQYITSKSIRNYLLFSIPISMLLVLFYYDFGELFLSKEYQSGFKIIPIIGLSYQIYSISHFYEAHFYALKRTSIILKYYMISAVINIILTFFFFNRWGILGAAYSFFVTSIILVILSFHYYKKLTKL